MDIDPGSCQQFENYIVGVLRTIRKVQADPEENHLALR